MKKNKIKKNKKMMITAISIIALIIILFSIIIPVLQGAVHYLIVLSGSMTPAINAGDVIITLEKEASMINEGDIITFNPSENSSKTPITHRVTNITKENNTIFFQTKGDANNVVDDFLVSEHNIIGTVIFTIPYLGYLPNFIQSPTGFILFIILPGSLLITSETRKIIQHTKQQKRKKEDE